ncbi:MAG: hypothetical protein CMO81_07700 [Waddliaceae bacterium]|nr:hypothetical protein [Waddliaceae bacterium]
MVDDMILQDREYDCSRLKGCFESSYQDILQCRQATVIPSLCFTVAIPVLIASSVVVASQSSTLMKLLASVQIVGASSACIIGSTSGLVAGLYDNFSAEKEDNNTQNSLLSNHEQETTLNREWYFRLATSFKPLSILAVPPIIGAWTYLHTVEADAAIQMFMISNFTIFATAGITASLACCLPFSDVVNSEDIEMNQV